LSSFYIPAIYRDYPWQWFLYQSWRWFCQWSFKIIWRGVGPQGGIEKVRLGPESSEWSLPYAFGWSWWFTQKRQSQRSFIWQGFNLLFGYYQLGINGKKLVRYRDPGFAIGERSAEPFAWAATAPTGNLRLLDTWIFK